AASLQLCINAWHEQAYVHALIDQPNGVFLVFQIPRSGPDGKDYTAISSDRYVQVPYFDSGVGVVWRRFEVVAVVEHHGDRVTEGHYRSVLRLSDADWLHTDDHTCATCTAWSVERSRLAYLFWLIPAEEDAAPCAPELPSAAPEWDFYTKFWPSNQPPPPVSEGSTTAPDAPEVLADQREAKMARHTLNKGQGGGKGPAGGRGGAAATGRGGAPAGRSAPGAAQGSGGSPSRPQQQPQWQRSGARADGRDDNTWHRGGQGWRAGWGSGGYGGGGGDGGGGDGLAQEVRDLQYAMGLVQRLALRLEDASVLTRIESSFVVNLKMNVPSSVVSMLFAAAAAWKKVKDEEPQRLDRPMRCALLVCFFAELRERMLSVVEQEDQMKEMESMGWVVRGPPVVWHFVKWDQATQRQIVDTTRPPLSQAELLELVAQS
ncbi:unnamed protein product, partial [Symbiodinium necroappetens]